MSFGKEYLHSHSGLERELRFTKHTVLVDEKYGDLFLIKQPFIKNKNTYYKVPIMEFVNKGGIFKNLLE